MGSGLYGGAMLLDPSGRLLGMDIILPLLPVPNYILPGLLLFTVMGLGRNARCGCRFADLVGGAGGTDWLQRRDPVLHGRQRAGAGGLCPVAFGETQVSIGLIMRPRSCLPPRVHSFSLEAALWIRRRITCRFR